MLIDTHCHLNFNAYKDDIDEVVRRTLDAGMRVINVGSQRTTSERAIKIAQKYPGKMFAAVALHPIHLHSTHVDDIEIPFTSREEEFDETLYDRLAGERGVVAVGECGLDYFRMPYGIDEREVSKKQKDVFLKHIGLARKHSLPLILHCRSMKEDPEKAYLEMLEVLQHARYFRGVVHCYGSTLNVAKKFLDAGFLISFTGIITFPNAESLSEVVKYVPLDRLMVETDAPYLAPQQFRGKRNEPLYVQYIAQRVAEVKGIPYDEVERQTTENAVEFFGLG